MSEKIKLVFLGTSAQMPSSERNNNSIFLSYKGENILVDCGEGTQRQMRKARLNPCKLTKILITHWHGDHILGIPGLLQTLSASEYNRPLSIYGPKGTKNFMETILETFVFQGKIKLNVEEVSGKFFEADDFYLEAEKMTHGIPCNAYNFVIKETVRIEKKKLAQTKISGAILKELKSGKDIIFQGKKYLAKNLTYMEQGKKVSFVFDTSMNPKIAPFVKNANLLICESTFDEECENKATDYHHLTSAQTAKIAKDADVKTLILTHLSQRYNQQQKEVLGTAKKIFKNSFLAKDFDKAEVD